MWLARDKVNDRLYLYIYDKPRKGEKSGMFFNESNVMTAPSSIHIIEKDDTYKDITWENSPIEITHKNIPEIDFGEPDYNVITWPDIQNYMNIDGFEEHSILLNSEEEIKKYGSSAYLIEYKWLKKANRILYGS